jgi:hypothetical protein
VEMGKKRKGGPAEDGSPAVKRPRPSMLQEDMIDYILHCVNLKARKKALSESAHEAACAGESARIRALEDGGRGELDAFKELVAIRAGKARAAAKAAASGAGSAPATPERPRRADEKEGDARKNKKKKSAAEGEFSLVINLEKRFSGGGEASRGGGLSDEEEDSEEEDSWDDSEDERAKEEEKKKKGAKASERDLCQPWNVANLSTDKIELLAYDGRKDLQKRVCADAKLAGRHVHVDKQGAPRKPHQVRYALYYKQLEVIAQRMLMRVTRNKVGPKALREAALEMLEEVQVQAFYTQTAHDKGWVYADAFEAEMMGSTNHANIIQLTKKQDKVFEKLEKSRKEEEKEKKQKQQQQRQQQQQQQQQAAPPRVGYNTKFSSARGAFNS